MSGSTTARQGRRRRARTARGPTPRRPQAPRSAAITSRTASTSSAVRSQNTSIRSSASNTGTWTPRFGSRRSRPSVIRIWVAARNECRAMPSRSANSASRRRAPGSSCPSRISSRSTLAAASTVETVPRRRSGRGGALGRRHLSHYSTIRQIVIGGLDAVRAAQRVGDRGRAESGSRSPASSSPRAHGCWSPTGTATDWRPCPGASRPGPPGRDRDGSRRARRCRGGRRARR